MISKVTTDTFNTEVLPFLSSYMCTYKDATAISNQMSKAQRVYITTVKHSQHDLWAVTNYYSPQVTLTEASLKLL